MEAPPMPVVGKKRSCLFENGDNNCKRARKEDLGPFHGGAGGEPALGLAVGGSVENGGESYTPSLNFVDGPLPAFDCSSLSAALPVEGSDGEPDNDVKDLVSVYVPGATSAVNVSSQYLIRLILRKLKLRLYGWSVVSDSEGHHTGCIESETPAGGVDGKKGRGMFMGDECDTSYRAMESASAAAVDAMVREHNVILKDFSHAKVQELERRLLVEQILTSALIFAKDNVEMKEKKLHEECAAFYRKFAAIVEEFSYLLPVYFVPSSTTSAGAVNRKAVYGGVRPPSSNNELFAEALVDLFRIGFAIFKDSNEG